LNILQIDKLNKLIHLIGITILWKSNRTPICTQFFITNLYCTDMCINIIDFNVKHSRLVSKNLEMVPMQMALGISKVAARTLPHGIVLSYIWNHWRFSIFVNVLSVRIQYISLCLYVCQHSIKCCNNSLTLNDNINSFNMWS